MKYTRNLARFNFSYSSVTTFEQCPYGFKLGYIDKVSKVENFFSQYGSFIHDIMERYFDGNLDIWDLSDYYTREYHTQVTELLPDFLSRLAIKYYDVGFEFFENFDFDKTEYEVLKLEEFVKGKDRKTNVIIKPDLVFRKIDEDQLILMDFKTSEVVDKKGNVDEDKLNGYKKQINLYIYYLWQFKNLEIQKAKLWFIRSNTFYEWDYDSTNLEDVEWFMDTIKKIKKEENWQPKPEKFFCNVLCSVREHCEFKAEM